VTIGFESIATADAAEQTVAYLYASNAFRGVLRVDRAQLIAAASQQVEPRPFDHGGPAPLYWWSHSYAWCQDACAHALDYWFCFNLCYKPHGCSGNKYRQV